MFLLTTNFISAAPTQLTNIVKHSLDDVQSLDSDQEIVIKSQEKIYKIKKEIAEKSHLLKKTMENDKDETLFTIQLKPKEFEMVIKFLGS